MTTGQADLECVATFDFEHEAQLARVHLEGAGITAWVLNRRQGGMHPWMEVAVRRDDGSAAREVLLQFRADPKGAAARTRSPIVVFAMYLPLLLLGLMALARLLFLVIRR